MMPFHSFPVIHQLFLARLTEGVWRERAGLFIIVARVRLHMCVCGQKREHKIRLCSNISVHLLQSESHRKNNSRKVKLVLKHIQYSPFQNITTCQILLFTTSVGEWEHSKFLLNKSKTIPIMNLRETLDADIRSGQYDHTFLKVLMPRHITIFS